MIPQTKWLERTFRFDFPVGHFPNLLERFRGTPARLEEMVRPIPHERRILRVEGRWSIQEHAGHLLDLSALDESRLWNYLNGASTLTAADIQNRKTHEARHNEKNTENLLSEFRRFRTDLVHRLERLSEEEIARTSLHPRLNVQLRLVDWLCFMCEHDDHHLAHIRALARA